MLLGEIMTDVAIRISPLRCQSSETEDINSKNNHIFAKISEKMSFLKEKIKLILSWLFRRPYKYLLITEK